MHPRDARILALARRLVGPRPSFSDAVGALSAAVTQIIPAGRVFVIGTTLDGPIVGSAISGIGIAPRAHDVAIVRVGADGHVLHLDAWLAPHELTPHATPHELAPHATPHELATHELATHELATHDTPHELAPRALRAPTPPRDVARAGVLAK
jgi:hypothetical protein